VETPADERHLPLTDDAALCPVCLGRDGLGERGGVCSAHAVHRVDRLEIERSFGDPFLGRTVVVGGLSYALVSVAGRGSQSRVFAARPLDGGSLVAVKLVRLDAPDEGLEKSSIVANRLWRELEVAALLEGVQGAPRALGPVEPGGAGLPPFEAIALEWVDRAPLPRPLGSPLVAAWAKTLQAAHTRGLAHADLAPDHLTWGPGGARVLDWGCAVALGAPVAAGRRAFASRELAASLRADAASDWFALGASLRALGTPLSEELEALVERLVGSPDERPGAVAELLGRG
jgi:serine/threonine protein kinase